MKTEKSFNRIVLATDGSEGAQAAVLATIELARFSSATVRVAHIWNLEVHHRHGVWDVEVRAEAERLVQETVDQLTRAGVMAEKEIFRADEKHIAASIAVIAPSWSCARARSRAASRPAASWSRSPVATTSRPR
jgi:nucleotide-binding universal stress UspA family protein